MQLAHLNLPYAYDALEPYVSRATLELHHREYHRARVDQAKSLAKELRLHDLPLEQIILLAARGAHQKPLLRCAVEVWNDAFFWRSLRPGGGGQPVVGNLAERLVESFGGYSQFCDRFHALAANDADEGRVWLVLDGDKLTVHQMLDGETPWLHGMSPLLVLDIWGLAGSRDYAGKRGEFVSVCLKHLLNWDFAKRNLDIRHLAKNSLDPNAAHIWQNEEL